jgi:hypothetical protein
MLIHEMYRQGICKQTYFPVAALASSRSFL